MIKLAFSPFPNFLESLFYIQEFTRPRIHSVHWVNGCNCHLLPETQGIYFLTTTDWIFGTEDRPMSGRFRDLQYIGIARDLKARFCQSFGQRQVSNLSDIQSFSNLFYVPDLDDYCISKKGANGYYFQHQSIHRFLHCIPTEHETIQDLYIYYFDLTDWTWENVNIYEKTLISILQPPHNRRSKNWIQKASYDELQIADRLLCLINFSTDWEEFISNKRKQKSLVKV